MLYGSANKAPHKLINYNMNKIIADKSSSISLKYAMFTFDLPFPEKR